MSANEQAAETTIAPSEARKLIGAGGAAVLDLSSDEEWERVGNIPGAVRIPEDDVESRLDDLPDRDKVLVVCPDGQRSAEVAERLRERGVEAVSLDGGMQAWQDDQLPLQPSEDPTLPGDPGSVEGESAPAG